MFCAAKSNDRTPVGIGEGGFGLSLVPPAGCCQFPRFDHRTDPENIPPHLTRSEFPFQRCLSSPRPASWQRDSGAALPGPSVVDPVMRRISSCHLPLSIVFVFPSTLCPGTGCGVGCRTLRNSKPQSVPNEPGRPHGALYSAENCVGIAYAGVRAAFFHSKKAGSEHPGPQHLNPLGTALRSPDRASAPPRIARR